MLITYWHLDQRQHNSSLLRRKAHSQESYKPGQPCPASLVSISSIGHSAGSGFSVNSVVICQALVLGKVVAGNDYAAPSKSVNATIVPEL